MNLFQNPLRFLLPIVLGVLVLGTTTSDAASTVEVFHNFLTEEELANLSSVDVNLSLEGMQLLQSGYGVTSTGGRTFGIAKLDKSIAERIHKASGITAKEGYSRAIPVSEIFTTTDIHTDYEQVNEERVPVNDKVGLIFLNSNEDAAFSHGVNEPIPVKAGTLVVFDGDVPHRTIVKGGAVRIAGAFRLDSFSLVSIKRTYCPNGNSECPSGSECKGCFLPGRKLFADELKKAHNEAVKEEELADAQVPERKLKGKSSCPAGDRYCKPTKSPKSRKGPKGSK